MPPKKILFICGSINQTTQMHQIASELPGYRHVFTPYYDTGAFEVLRKMGALEHTIGGNKLRGRCLEYLRDHHLTIDLGGLGRDIALVFHCSDLVWPHNLEGRKVILVQEGMTDPESPLLPVVRRFRWIPAWVAGTSATGLTDRYERFCVASPGYRDLFVRRGARPEKVVVTGIPNFDDCRRYLTSDFPHRGHVLVCTSDIREMFGREDRPALIRRAVAIAAGRQLVFKLHPNEQVARARAEIWLHAPGALIYATGSAEEMVGGCEVLICQYSSLAYVGLALGKEVHSAFPLEELRRLLPLQHGMAAKNIAAVGRELLGDLPAGAAWPAPGSRMEGAAA